MCSRTDFWFHLSHYVCGEKKKMNRHATFLFNKRVSNVSMYTYFSINNQGHKQYSMLAVVVRMFSSLPCCTWQLHSLTNIKVPQKLCLCKVLFCLFLQNELCTQHMAPSPLSHSCDHSTSHKSKATPCACGRKTKEFGITG